MRRGDLRRQGFTLIEVSVVLFLMALLASVVALSARGMVGNATRDEVLTQIESLDQSARRHACQSGKDVQVELDTVTGRIMLTHPIDATPLGGYQLPNGYTFKEAWRERRGERDEQQRLVLHYDPDGVTSNWGVSLSTPESAETPDSIAMLVLGMTGQITKWENDGKAQDILAQVQRRHTD